MMNRVLFCIWSLTVMLLAQLLGSSQVHGALVQDEKLTDSKKQAEALQKKRDKIYVLLPAAAKAFESGDYEKAFANAKKICELAPDDFRLQSFLGEVSFASGEFETCVTAYDAMIRIAPSIEPSLWQRGLALYYADRFEDGVKQFETHQTVNSQDVENAVWHLLCAARVSDVDAARKRLIPITGDTRVPMSQVYEMFAGRMAPDEVLKASLETSARVQEGGEGHRLQQYYAHLYIGLYHEMLGKNELAIASLKKAKEINPLGKMDFMGQVARVHLDLREKQANESSEKPMDKKKSGKETGKAEADKEKSSFDD